MARKARSSPEDLATELGKPSFTPGLRDVPGLIELVVDGAEPGATRAARALAGLGAAHVPSVIAALADRDEAARARLVGTLGQLARGGADDAVAAVVAATRDGSPRVRRAAANALGKLGGDRARDALIARWDAPDVSADERRALAEALGKVGGEAALSRLRAAASGDDAELARRRDRALLMADRTARRDEDSQIVTDVAPPSPLVVRLATRGGIAPLLVEELAQLRIAGTALSDRVVQLDLAAPWSTLFASRLWVAGAIRIPFEPPPRGPARRDDRVADPDALAAAIVRAIVAPSTEALLRRWTRGPIRWRLGFAHGHKRAIVWRVARDVTAAAPALVNDPTATTWDFVIDDQAGTLEVVPRRFDDPRFAWRVAEVPASSHPTVAAALAWVAGARETDRVWDPFCGAGAELVERARRGPYRTLLGTDLDPAALEAARANAAAAGIDAITLARADARTHDPGTVDLIITNPPLGSRVQLDAAALCCDALPHFARHLAPGGRLVWITPSTRRTTPVAERLGLQRTRSLAVDLGGVRGQLERWEAR